MTFEERFYAAVARWLQPRVPNWVPDVSRVLSVSQDTSCCNGNEYCYCSDADLTITYQAGGVVKKYAYYGDFAQLLRDLTDE